METRPLVYLNGRFYSPDVVKNVILKTEQLTGHWEKLLPSAITANVTNDPANKLIAGYMAGSTGLGFLSGFNNEIVAGQELTYAIGLYNPQSEQIEKLRANIADDVTHELKRASKSKKKGLADVLLGKTEAEITQSVQSGVIDTLMSNPFTETELAAAKDLAATFKETEKRAAELQQESNPKAKKPDHRLSIDDVDVLSIDPHLITEREQASAKLESEALTEAGVIDPIVASADAAMLGVSLSEPPPKTTILEPISELPL